MLVVPSVYIRLFSSIEVDLPYGELRPRQERRWLGRDMGVRPCCGKVSVAEVLLRCEQTHGAVSTETYVIVGTDINQWDHRRRRDVVTPKRVR